MIADQLELSGGLAETDRTAALGVADWLCLAAAPTFAIMALLTGLSSGDPDLICTATHSSYSLGGMAAMYAMMTAFHLAPWLKLAAGRRNAARAS